MANSQVSKFKTSHAGFTVVELVIVIIILGVLSVTAIPKLIEQSSFEDYTLRDQLISRLRLVQLQGMNADPSDDATDNACYWLVVKSNCFYHEQTSRSGENCNSPSSTNVCDDDDYNQYNSVSFESGMLSEATYRFDLSGTLSSDSNTSPITINGDNDLAIKIESEGYIHASI